MAGFQYVIAVDFEATNGESNGNNRSKAEIIEFAAVLMNLKAGKIESEFHEFVKPVEMPILSDFIKTLTGIKQETVNQASLLQEVLSKFYKWLGEVVVQYNLIMPKTGLLNPDENYNCAFVCWTDFDMNIFLQNECNRKSIEISPYFNHWVDISTIYSNYYGTKSLAGAMTHIGLKFEGKQHSGIDDARNTAALLLKMTQLGKPITITSSLK